MQVRIPKAIWLVAVLVLVVAACDDGEDAEPEAPAEPAPEETADAEPDHLAAVGADEWTTLAPAPAELQEIDAVAFDGEIWTVGGITAEPLGVATTVLVYDPVADRWREGPPLPEPVHHAAMAATDEELVVMGGYRTLEFDPLDDVWVLDPTTDEWRTGPSLPVPRGAGAAAWDGERVVFGGGIGPDGLADDVWTLDDTSEGEWRSLGPLGVARDHLDATSDGDGTVWFLAGREDSLAANLATVDVVEGDTIREIGELPTPRGGVAGFFSETHGACLAGGEEPESTFAEVECMDADGQITVLPDLAEPRHGLGAGVVDGIAYVVLGGPEPLLAVSDTIEALRIGDPAA